MRHRAAHVRLSRSLRNGRDGSTTLIAITTSRESRRLLVVLIMIFIVVMIVAAAPILVMLLIVFRQMLIVNMWVPVVLGHPLVVVNVILPSVVVVRTTDGCERQH